MGDEQGEEFREVTDEQGETLREATDEQELKNQEEEGTISEETEEQVKCKNEKDALTKKLQLKDHADLVGLRKEIDAFKESCQDVSVTDLETGLEEELEKEKKRQELEKKRPEL